MEPESSREVFRGKLIRVEVEQWPAGEREIVHHPGACGVVALTRSGEVLLVKQFREAVRQALLEIPAGIYDLEGEDPADCAARELREETGYRVRDVRPLGSIYPSPGFTDERIELFVAEVDPDDADPVAEAGIEVRLVPIRDAMAAVSRGEITDAKTAAGLLLAVSRGNA